MANAEAETCS